MCLWIWSRPGLIRRLEVEQFTGYLGEMVFKAFQLMLISIKSKIHFHPPGRAGRLGVYSPTKSGFKQRATFVSGRIRTCSVFPAVSTRTRTVSGLRSLLGNPFGQVYMAEASQGTAFIANAASYSIPAVDFTLASAALSAASKSLGCSSTPSVGREKTTRIAPAKRTELKDEDPGCSWHCFPLCSGSKTVAGTEGCYRPEAQVNPSSFGMNAGACSGLTLSLASLP